MNNNLAAMVRRSQTTAAQVLADWGEINQREKLAQDILNRVIRQPDGWVDATCLTVLADFDLLRRGGKVVADYFRPAGLIEAIVAPPSRAPILAIPTATYLPILSLVYPRRERQARAVPPGFVPVTIHSHFEDGPADFMMPEKPPLAGSVLFLVVDDFLRHGRTAAMLINFTVKRWGWRCAGVAVLVEINGAGGRERLMSTKGPGLADEQILALARIGPE